MAGFNWAAIVLALLSFCVFGLAYFFYRSATKIVLRGRRVIDESKAALVPNPIEQEFIHRLLEELDEAVLLLDEHSCVIRINAAAKEMLLLDVSHQHRPLLELVRSAQLAEVVKWAMVSNLSQRKEIEFPLIKPRTIQVRAIPLARAYVLLIFADMTERTRLESLTREFVSHASHELRTPLTSIASAIETLGLVLERENHHALKWVDLLDRNSRRLLLLIEELLDLSQLEAQKMKLYIEVFDLQKLVSHVFDLFRERAAKSGCQLLSEIPLGIEIKTDKRALERILSNLIDNAIKYAASGKSIHMHYTNSVDSIYIHLKDFGAGVSPEHLPRLFERFYRIDEGRSREYGGTGLGLAIVKQLSSALGGEISAESRVGEGTEFKLKLPLR